MPFEMVNAQTECPVPATWKALLEGKLGDAEHTLLLEHAHACDNCASHLADLPSAWDLSYQHQALASEPLQLAAKVMLDGLAIKPAPAANSAATQALLPSSEWLDRPEIIKIPGLEQLVVVGQGGTSTVYQAVEIATGRRVAVKVPISAGRAGHAAYRRAFHEAATLTRFQHPHLVQILRSGMAGGVPYLVMEWLDGGTLQRRLETEPISHQMAAEIVRDLADALSHAHAIGIIHRDLKPSNVLLQSTADPDRPWIAKLSDFGLSREESDQQGLTESGFIVGTPCYMAPEQTGVTGNKVIGPATDIHGLGTILYALLTGTAPYAGRTTWDTLMRAAGSEYVPLPKGRRGVPRDLRTIVETCLQPNPQRRYRAAAELTDELDRFLTGKPIQARPISTAERTYKWARKNPAGATAAIVLTLAGLVAVTGTAYHMRSLAASEQKYKNETILTKQALGLANKTSDAFREPLTNFTRDIIERLMRKGNNLSENDTKMINQIRAVYLSWPLEPKPADSLDFQAKGLNLLADLYERIEDPEEMEHCRTLALDACSKSFAFAPNNPKLQQTLVTILDHKYASLRRSNDAEERQLYADLRVTEHEKLADAEPERRVHLSHAYIDLATELFAQQRREDALAVLNRAEALMSKLLSEPTGNEMTIHNVVLAYTKLAGLCRTYQLPQQQEEAYLRAGYAAAGVAVRKSPLNASYTKHQWMLGIELGVNLLAQKRPEEARLALLNSLELCLKQMESLNEPRDRASNAQSILTALHLFRQACTAAGRPQEVEPRINEFIAVCQTQWRKNITDRESNRCLVRALLESAMLLEDMARPDEARYRYEELIEVARPWSDYPNQEDWANQSITSALDRMIELYDDTHDYEIAVTKITKRIPLCSPEETSRFVLKLLQLHLANRNYAAAWETTLEYE